MSIDQRISGFDKDNYYPRLRSGIDFSITKDDNGNTFLALTDTLGITNKQLLLSTEFEYLLEFFNGLYSIQEIYLEYARKNNNIKIEKLYELVKFFDQYYLLDSPRYITKITQLKQEYQKLPSREPVCSGNSYPDNSSKLKKFLDDLYFQKCCDNNFDSNDFIKAMIVPHIDLQLGADSYIKAYTCLRQLPMADLYVILGIGHMGIDNLFALTTKNFNTPLGEITTHSELVQKVANHSNYDFLDDELVHKDEHSIEFQTLFLKHMNPDAIILPVLCSFSPFVFENNGNSYKTIFDDFINSMKTALSSFDGSVCFIASVDFAHVGSQYDDTHKVDDLFLNNMYKNDKSLIESLLSWDHDQFQKIMNSNKDYYHICGYSALSTLLHLVSPSSGMLLDHQTADMGNNSYVSFASLLFQ